MAAPLSRLLQVQRARLDPSGGKRLSYNREKTAVLQDVRRVRSLDRQHRSRKGYPDVRASNLGPRAMGVPGHCWR
ncbi:hypothetical protein WJX73_008473 [Symbiochloris irregularis]|uniref:Uncharacterized protein n=1 Tax=Symbiochloris irregularis TaxID=706552 RepID=A0AAW1P6Q2_9CHLO